MVYLPTLIPSIIHGSVNIPYVDPMGIAGCVFLGSLQRLGCLQGPSSFGGMIKEILGIL